MRSLNPGGDASSWAESSADSISPGAAPLYFGVGYAVASDGDGVITLDSEPLTGSVHVFVNGAALAPTVDWDVSGDMITMAVALSASDKVLVYWATEDSPPGGISLSELPDDSPELRGTNIVGVSSNAVTISFPAGSVAGDRAVLFAAGAYSIYTPSGWTDLSALLTGSYWNGAAFSKVLDSSDISTGSVTVNYPATYDAVVAIVVFVGATAGIREAVKSRNNPGSATVDLSTSGAVLSSDTIIYFGSNRANSTDTCNRGPVEESLATGDGSGCLYSERLTASGAVTATFGYGTAGSGNYQAAAVVKGL